MLTEPLLTLREGSTMAGKIDFGARGVPGAWSLDDFSSGADKAGDNREVEDNEGVK